MLGTRVDLIERLEGGRGGRGDVARHTGDWAPGVDGAPKTEDRAGRAFRRDCVGIVRRRAVGLEDGVVGRVGGILNSCTRLVEYL